MSEKLSKVKLLRMNITAETEKRIIEYIIKGLGESHKKIFITTPNPEIICYALSSPRFEAIINTSDVALPDGIGIIKASQFLNLPIKSRITGVDFMKSLCEKLSKRTETVGLLGGKGGVAGKAAECLKKMYPGLRVIFIGEEWDELKMKDKQIDVLFVAFGFPKQEEWIYKNLPHIRVKVAMGVGGAFDYIGGTVIRAPRRIQSIGLEWLFRLIIQPWRWKRQLALIRFTALVLQERFKKL